MQETETKKIYKAINNVMEEIGAIGKNQRNQTQGFMFRGIDAVYNAMNPALIKHGVFIVPEILEQTREERTTKSGTHMIYSVCRIRFRFYAEDGSYIEATVIGEGMDTGDKATNKAMSIAFKYACFEVFCIPTEEMVDPDRESYETAPRGKTGGTKKEGTRTAEEAAIAGTRIKEPKLTVIKKEMQRTGVSLEALMKQYKIKALEEMTEEMFADAVKKFEHTKTKEAVG